MLSKLVQLSHYTELRENNVAATYEPIAATTLGSAASSITFSSIASTWTDLRLVLTAKGTSSNYPYMRFNSDSGSNYSLTRLQGDGSSAASGRQSNQTELFLINGSLDTTIPGLITVDIFSYAGSTYKTFLTTGSTDQNGVGYVVRIAGLWRSTSAITSVYLYTSPDQFAAGTTATLYGIKAA